MANDENNESKPDWKHFPKLWFDRASATQDPLCKFMCLMIAFNDL